MAFLACLASLAAQAQPAADQSPAQTPDAQSASEGAPQQPPAGPPEAPAPKQKSKSWLRWLDPDTAPFIPVPEIDVDPNSGTTLGIIPTRLYTDDQGAIRTIVAPDIIHNPYFGWGARGRIYAYPSEDTQWYVVGGAKQHVESEFDAMLDTGRLRNGPWSFTLEGVYDRSGTPRFYGIGNNSPIFNQTVYTDQQLYARVVAGWNITHHWQLAYTFLPRKVTILGAHLPGIPSTGSRFHHLLGLGVTHEMLNRVSLTYDTRDDLTVPTHGTYVVGYGGMASRNGVPNQSLFSESGFDARKYWTPDPGTTLVGHAALRILPSAHAVPFWALSSLGGDTSEIGGSMPLRGYGTGRFYDHNAYVMNFEVRQHVYSLDFSGTHIDLQLTPFADAGRVFHTSTVPLTHLHPVEGLGIRAIARPSVVGYVDIGRGTEGLAIFTGINYPF
jgi:hypothetical protein